MKAINDERKSILRKISSLLNLASDGESNEALTALAKARELIAKHNVELHEIEVSDESCKPVAKETSESYAVEFTKQTSLWMLHLASILAQYHGCVVLTHKAYRARRTKITFVGEGDQAELVDAIFHKIIPFIQIKYNAILAKYSGYYCRQCSRQLADQYAYGFIDGLESYYREQNAKDSSCALMVIVPECVKEATSQYKSTTYKHKIDNRARREGAHLASEGYSDGHSYNQEKLHKNAGSKYLAG